MNLLEETKLAMFNACKEPQDIVFIGSLESGACCSWSEFEVLADQEYDCGFGGSEVAQNLVICFEDGSRLIRAEYDGSEWWEFIDAFKEPEIKKPIHNLFTGWKDL